MNPNCSHMYCCTGRVCMAAEAARLADTLNRQSTQLAEALKEKNDTKQRAYVLEGQVCQLTETVKVARMDARSWKDLYAAEQAAKEKAQAELGNRTADLVKANLELARLRPVEPKFRVGQVVKWGGHYYQIYAMRTNGIISSKWEYQLANTGSDRWEFEERLRALTDEEK